MSLLLLLYINSVTSKLVPKSTRTYFWSTRTLVNSYLSQLVTNYLYLFGVSFIEPQMYLARALNAVCYVPDESGSIRPQVRSA